ncbi:MAG: ClpXP protease specificity-enhancing factor SspB [Pseudomonadota bacterium]
MAELNYGQMMQRAMQSLVVEALRTVAENGLPGDHHFYITFQSNQPGVDIPDWLREEHPETMTIVLQHEFHDLAVGADRFSVGLSFSGRLANLVVPFDAILQFADPSAEFGLRFEPTLPDDDEAHELEDDAEPAPEPLVGAEELDPSEPREQSSGEVVSLDAFRKK